MVLPEPDEEEDDWRTGAGGTVATFIRANVKSISIPLYLESEVCKHLGDDVNEVFTNRRLRSELNAWTPINLQVVCGYFWNARWPKAHFVFVCDSAFFRLYFGFVIIQFSTSYQSHPNCIISKN